MIKTVEGAVPTAKLLLLVTETVIVLRLAEVFVICHCRVYAELVAVVLLPEIVR